MADILDSLANADHERRLRERIRYLCRASLLIIDEIGYLTVGSVAGNLFFQLVKERSPNPCTEAIMLHKGKQ